MRHALLDGASGSGSGCIIDTALLICQALQCVQRSHRFVASAGGSRENLPVSFGMASLKLT